jgi:sulfopropanediol 3-dehydrogenase
MAITYLKKAAPRPAAESNDIRDIVQVMLTNIARDGEEAVHRYAQQLDGWTGSILLSDSDRQAACDRVSQDLKEDIQLLMPTSVALPKRRKPPWVNARSRSFPA